MLTYNRTVFSPAKPVLIVLVWDDPPSDVVSTSQVPLKNQLSLSVGGGLYKGNAFNENLTSNVEDGYSYRFNVGASFNDASNNVEAVFIPADTFAAGQAIGISVVSSSATSGYVNGKQAFSIYAYNVQ